MKKLVLISFLLASSYLLQASIQYASSVIVFSSQYGTASWSVEKTLGAPDVYPNYGDWPNAWASQTPAGQREFLVLGYANPMRISNIGVYETFNPGAVDTIYVRNASNGQWVMVWSGTAAAQPAVSRIYEVSFELTSFNVDAVRIAINSPFVSGWNEIDAVAIADETITGGGSGGGGSNPGEIVLLAHYPLTGHADDISGNDFHGTIVGTVVPSDGPNGEPNGAMYFNGQQSYILIGKNEVLDNPGNALTITYWVKIDAFYFNLWASVVCKSDNAEAHYRLGHGRNSTFFAYNGMLAYNTANYPIGVDDGWVFVAASYDSDSVRFYKNDALLHTMPLMLNSEYTNRNNNLYIGYDPALGADWLTGHVHDVRIYSGALNSGQVMAVMEGEEPASNRTVESPGEIRVYPIPAADIINVNTGLAFEKNKTLTYAVYDLQGRNIKQGNLLSVKGQIDVSGIKPGVYVLRVTDGKTTGHARIVKK